nr:glycoside hydrolase family 3 N-terminal domain-containing protein [uncultured Microbacterium sp.]
MTDVDGILQSLTLREQVGQLNQRLYGWQSVRRVRGGWELTDTFLDELERWTGMGALYGLFRADAWSGRDWTNGIKPEERAEVSALVQDAVAATSRHGVGVLLSEEAPHGHQALGAPLLPANFAIGATWHPELLEEASAAVAASLRAQGVHLALVSTLDMLRDPRWGRSEECFGESPELAAAMTRAVVRGMQGEGRARLIDGTGLGVVLKHFAAQGDGLGGRNGQSAAIGGRELREIHLEAAREGVREGAVSVMAAYTDIDGIPCVAHQELLTSILRDEWGFDGIVMADGKSVDRILRQVGTPVAAAAAAVTAGVDLSLWDESFTHLEEAAERSPEVAAAVRQACRRVLELKGRFGLLGESPAHARPSFEAYERAVDDVRRTSIELAAESVVMMSNRGALPAVAPSGQRWLVVGRNAEDPTSLLGDYVAPIGPEGVRSVADELRAAGERRGVTVESLALPGLVDGELPAEVLADLQSADRVIAVIGGTSHRHTHDSFADNGAALQASDADAGEGVDRADLRLPHDQERFVQALRVATPAPLIAVVVAGRPYVLSAVLENVDALLFAAYPGPGGGRAVADIVFGDRQPVGRLAASMPAHPGVVPVREDDRHDPAHVYHDVDEPVLARVGSGLGYAAVTSERVEVEVGADGVSVALDLAHAAGDAGWTGAAEEVVQVFIERRGAVVVPRRSELVRFDRISLAPGETRRLSLTLPLDRAFVPVAERAPFADVVSTVRVVVGRDAQTFEVRPRA